MQLVAYIHLNPLRAGLVQDVSALGVFPFAGHSALMRKMSRPWQDTECDQLYCHSGVVLLRE